MLPVRNPPPHMVLADSEVSRVCKTLVGGWFNYEDWRPAKRDHSRGHYISLKHVNSQKGDGCKALRLVSFFGSMTVMGGQLSAGAQFRTSIFQH